MWCGLKGNLIDSAVFISARPFFVGAGRDLARGRPGMDVPVALAIGGAYLVSVVATVLGTGEVYFDSVCMFTFFLSLGRFLEHRVRKESAAFVRERVDASPAFARRLEEGVAPEFAADAVASPGDRHFVRQFLARL